MAVEDAGAAAAALLPRLVVRGGVGSGDKFTGLRSRGFEEGDAVAAGSRVGGVVIGVGIELVEDCAAAPL